MIKKLVLIMIAIVCMLSTISFAASGVSVNQTPIPGLTTPVSTVLGMIQWIGFVVGIGMVLWIGIKYITAGASGKAEVKSTMVPWLVGAALIVLASTIASGIYSAIGGGGSGSGTGASSETSAYTGPYRDVNGKEYYLDRNGVKLYAD